MSKVLLDTCVFSYVLKGDTRALAYRACLEHAQPCLCFMTMAELYRWGLARRWGAKRLAVLRQRIAECQTLTYDDAMGWEWARVMTLPGRPMPSADAWIAACALRHRLPLVTHNRDDFAHIPGLELAPESRQP